MRTILHVDMDAFFASVEEQEHPEYRDKPLAVGGHSRRGIVTTANYIARQYGLHSAMPIFQAKALCPSLILIEPHFEIYRQYSKQVFDILRSYTRIVEPASIDEAYLDVSRRPEDGQSLATWIQQEIEDKTGLSCSIGISNNKFLAKMASDWKKPHGIFQMMPEDFRTYCASFPVERLHGIGKSTAQKLRSYGIHTVEDLYPFSQERLHQLLGKFGDDLYHRVRGQDSRPVLSSLERKSVGNERTFEHDVSTLEQLKPIYAHLIEKLLADLSQHALCCRTLQIKWKTSVGDTHTRSKTESSPLSKEQIPPTAWQLFEKLDGNTPLRLLGLSASQLEPIEKEQMNLFDYF